MLDADDRHEFEAQAFRCQQARVAGDDDAVWVNQHRHQKPCLIDAERELLELLLGMVSQLALIWLKLRDRHEFDL
jgi:hypothetical protein